MHSIKSVHRNVDEYANQSSFILNQCMGASNSVLTDDS